MSKILKKLADHAVAVMILSGLLLILLGVGLLLRPALVIEILRYLFAVVNIGFGGFLLVSNAGHIRKK